MCRYYIRRRGLGLSAGVELSAEEFEAYEEAIHGLVQTWAIEQKYNLLIRNYQRFNTAVHQAHEVAEPVDNVLYELCVDVDLAVVNLVTTCRLYLDQVSHQLSELFGKPSSEFDAFQKSRSKEYDDGFSYRLMEAVRNHVQHQSLPVRSVVVSESAEGRNVRFVFDADSMRSNRKLKAPFLKEIGSRETPDVRTAVEEYIASLVRIHTESARCLIGGLNKAGRDSYEEIVSRYRNEIEGNIVGLALCSESEGRRAYRPVSENLVSQHDRLVKDSDDRLSSG